MGKILASSKDKLTPAWQARLVRSTLAPLVKSKTASYTDLDDLYTQLIEELHGQCCYLIDTLYSPIVTITLKDIEEQVVSFLGPKATCPDPIRAKTLPEKLNQETSFFIKKTIHAIVRDAETKNNGVINIAAFEQLIEDNLGLNCLDDNNQIVPITLRSLEQAVRDILQYPEFQCHSDIESILSRKVDKIIAGENGFVKVVPFSQQNKNDLETTLTMMDNVETQRVKPAVEDNIHQKWNYVQQKYYPRSKYNCAFRRLLNCPLDMGNKDLIRQFPDLNALIEYQNRFFYWNLKEKSISEVPITDENRNYIGLTDNDLHGYSDTQKEVIVSAIIGRYKGKLHTVKMEGALIPTKPQYMYLPNMHGVGLFFNYAHCYTGNEAYSFKQGMDNASHYTNQYIAPKNNNLYASSEILRQRNRDAVSDERLTNFNVIKAGLPKNGVEAVFAFYETYVHKSENRQPKPFVEARLDALVAMQMTKEKNKLEYNLPIKIYNCIPRGNEKSEEPCNLHDYTHDQRLLDLIKEEWFIQNPGWFYKFDIKPSKQILNKCLLDLALCVNKKTAYTNEFKRVFQYLLDKGADVNLMYEHSSILHQLKVHYPVEIMNVFLKNGAKNSGPPILLDPRMDCTFVDLNNFSFTKEILLKVKSLVGTAIDKQTLVANGFRKQDRQELKDKIVIDYKNYFITTTNFVKIINALIGVLEDPKHPLTLRAQGKGDYTNTESLAVVINLGRKRLFEIAKAEHEKGQTIDASPYKDKLEQIFTAPIYSYQRNFFFLAANSDSALVALEYIKDPIGSKPVDKYVFHTSKDLSTP